MDISQHKSQNDEMDLPVTSTRTRSAPSPFVSVKLPPSLLPRRSHTRPRQSLNLMGKSSSAGSCGGRIGASASLPNTKTKTNTSYDSDDKDTSTTASAPTPSSTTTTTTTTTTNPSAPIPFVIGGPKTVLPFIVESTIVWILAISCLSVAMWHFIVQVYGASGSRHEKANKEKVSSSRTTNHSLLGLPLCTHSRRELDSVSTMPGMYERFEQLIQRLQVDRDIEEWLHPTNRSELVKFIRSTETVRRLVSLVMTRQDLWLTHDKSDDLLSLLGVLQEIWPQLLELPHHRDACMDGKGNQFTYEISVVVPLYREDGVDLKRKLQMAIAGIQSHCHHDTQSARGPVPKIEFVLVNAGQCQSLDVVYSWLSTFDGKQTNQSLTSASTSTQLPPKNATSKNVSIRVHDYDRGGGRGPCLNYGAKLARGRILTFLHADTRLVPGWDVSILTAFSASESNNSKAFTTACAFSFGIDTSPSALSAHNNEAYFPPGIKAIERTANWRTHLFHLPYGDQCLSVPSQIFAYLGGHPDQCILEDYELIRLLRQRVAITKTNLIARERLEILSLKAYCSPRRWQIYGVWFVTYMNSYVINRYAEGFTPDELFALYYGTPEAPPRRSAESPWELQLKQELGLYDQSNDRECMVD